MTAADTAVRHPFTENGASSAVQQVGILALQGDVEAHGDAIRALGKEAVTVKSSLPLDQIDALILPGGESTTMMRCLHREGLLEPLKEFCLSGRPVLGTCAGAILLASDVISPVQESLGSLEITIERNGYGRQLDSFITQIEDPILGSDPLEAVFIRAPVIQNTGDEVEVLLRYEDHPILVRQGQLWAATFHPELTTDLRILSLVLGR